MERRQKRESQAREIVVCYHSSCRHSVRDHLPNDALRTLGSERLAGCKALANEPSLQ